MPVVYLDDIDQEEAHFDRHGALRLRRTEQRYLGRTGAGDERQKQCGRDENSVSGSRQCLSHGSAGRTDSPEQTFI